IVHSSKLKIGRKIFEELVRKYIIKKHVYISRAVFFDDCTGFVFNILGQIVSVQVESTTVTQVFSQVFYIAGRKISAQLHSCRFAIKHTKSTLRILRSVIFIYKCSSRCHRREEHTKLLTSSIFYAWRQ